MSMVGLLLAFLLFGIVAFGYLMSFRQNMVQASAEGARAGAVAVFTTGDTQAISDATSAATQSLSFGKTCGSGSMVCTVTTGTCSNNVNARCITVQITYHYSQSPLLPDVPLLGSFLPTDITTKSVAQLNTS
jgi:Flp pilus assembly protein TadG